MRSAGPPYTAEILSIDPGRASDRAGLRRGDRFDVRAKDLVGRFNVLSDSAQPLTGEPIHLSVTRDALNLSVTVVPLPIDFTRRPDQIVAPIAVLWLVLFASIIAWRRAYVPGNLLLSAVLLITAIVSGAPSHGFAAPWAWVYVALAICFVAAPLGVATWATYASGFARPLSPPRRITLWTCYALVTAAMAVGIAQLVGTVTLWFDPVGLWFRPIWMLPMVAAILAALGCSLLAIAQCRGIDRQRAAWSLVPLPFVYLAFEAFLFINFTSSSYSLYVGFACLYSAITFIAPLSLTYAAVNRRLIDIGFVLNRTLVFAIVSAIVVGVFILAEWAASEWFASTSHTSSVVAGMLVALTLGLSMRYIHKYVDRFVDRVFFHKRHLDEAALRAFAHEASYITDRSVLLERSIQTVREHTDTEDVTIFLRGDSGSYREYPNARTAVSENDSAVIALRAWRKPVDMHDITGSQVPGAIAFPMIARGALLGAIVCGPKASGESFAPDEVDALVALAHGVSVALDSLSRESADSVALLSEVVVALQASIVTMQESVTADLRALGNSLRP
jgi:GAF domain